MYSLYLRTRNLNSTIILRQWSVYLITVKNEVNLHSAVIVATVVAYETCFFLLQ